MLIGAFLVAQNLGIGEKPQTPVPRIGFGSRVASRRGKYISEVLLATCSFVLLVVMASDLVAMAT